jgi:chromosome segregation ATPase
MSIKIKNIRISGIRGAKNSIVLPLNGKSILLYGDNGSGKSSISDSIEWFFTDKVSHLSGSEIDLKDALRNSTLADTDISEVSLSFTKSEFDNSKTIFDKRNKLISESTNSSDYFKQYIEQSNSENIILRYQYLTNFIDNTKGEKLKYLSDIIGFSEVTKKKEVLQKSYNSIKSEIRNQNFENQVNTQKQVLIEKIGAAISQEQNLFEILNEKIKPLKVGIEINSILDIDKILEHIKKPANNKLITELRFLENTFASLTTLKNEIEFINSAYEKYYKEFVIIANDVESIMQTFLSDLLKTGDKVLERKYHKDETCPFCLQPKNLDELRAEIAVRLKEIEESSKKKAAFDKAKQLVETISQERIRRLDSLLAERIIQEGDYSYLKTGITNLKNKIDSILNASNVKVTSGIGIPKPIDSKLQEIDFSFEVKASERIKEIQEIFKKDNSAVLYSNISASKDAFLKIKKIEVQKVKLEHQRKTLEIIYNEFVKKQKEALENFISKFSGKINEFYQYMNPGEPFQEIKIVTIGEDDELNGITIEYKYNEKWVSPPQKYFSESHLNCFGLSFFLASVEAFNNTNKFILLDDVISSFDSTHRKRFADLIFEKFSSYQIILLTHEREWFSGIVSPLAKKKGWVINEILWSDTNGTYIEEKPNELKELIESYIADGKSENLGNPLRRYLEHSLKDICYNLDVKVSFRFNDINEKRMPDELLNSLKSRIKEKSTELQAQLNIIERVAGSALLGNLLSHDNPFNPNIGDLKAFWADILEFEKMFTCQHPDCKRRKVSIYNYDTVAKKIRCGCDYTKYDWKK